LLSAKIHERIAFPVLSGGCSLRHKLLLFHTMSGSFLSSLEKRLEECAKIAYETQIKRACLSGRYTQRTLLFSFHLYFILNNRIIRAWIKPKKLAIMMGEFSIKIP
jgi:hypothetical protein